jgi:hypothetical protein
MNEDEHKHRNVSVDRITQVELWRHGVLKHGEWSKFKQKNKD